MLAKSDREVSEQTLLARLHSMAHSRVGDYTVITTAGDLDVETAAALRDAIGVVVEAGQRQEVVDLDAVDFFDSAGLGVLIGGMMLVRAHGGSFGVVCRWTGR